MTRVQCKMSQHVSDTLTCLADNCSSGNARGQCNVWSKCSQVKWTGAEAWILRLSHAAMCCLEAQHHEDPAYRPAPPLLTCENWEDRGTCQCSVQQHDVLKHSTTDKHSTIDLLHRYSPAIAGKTAGPAGALYSNIWP